MRRSILRPTKDALWPELEAALNAVSAYATEDLRNLWLARWSSDWVARDQVLCAPVFHVAVGDELLRRKQLDINNYTEAFKLKDTP